MIRESNASCAALMLCGENPQETKASRAQALFRDALRLGDTSIFDGFHYNFQCIMPAVAALEITSIFTGKGKTTFAGAEDSYPYDGFYLDGQGTDRFYEDSVDLEEIRETGAMAGYGCYQEFLGFGVNRMQAMDVLEMSTPVRVILSGTLVDFYRLWRAAAPNKMCRHPNTQIAARDIWAEITVTDRDFVEAAKEVSNA